MASLSFLTKRTENAQSKVKGNHIEDYKDCQLASDDLCHRIDVHLARLDREAITQGDKHPLYAVLDDLLHSGFHVYWDH